MNHDDTSTLPVAQWSCEAEQSLLGALLLDSRALDHAGAIAAADFYEPRHGTILDAVQRLVGQRRAVDVITVFEVLQSADQAESIGGLAYLNALAQSVPSARGVARYAEIVREKAAQRELQSAVDDALQIVRGRGDVPAKLERIAALLTPLQRQAVRKAPRRLAEIALERTAYYDDLAEGRVQAGWPTCIPALDRALSGGLRPGGFYIVAARPSVGKSSFSQQLATTQAEAGRPVLMLSQEMPDVEVADRAVAAAGGVSLEGLTSGRMGADDWRRATDALERLSDLPLFVDDEGALTLAAVKAKARTVQGLKVLVLDYLQLCSASAGLTEANRNAQVEEISRGLKAMAKDMGIAVIALSQLNRKVEERPSKRPNLGDLRDSGAVEQDADVVTFLWPVRQHDDSNRIVGCEVAKNRQGRTAAFALHFHGPTQRWHESTESLEPPAKSDTKRRDFE